MTRTCRRPWRTVCGRGIDAVSVYDVGRASRRISDDDQFAYATAEGRVLVTYNRDDYQALDGSWRRVGRLQPGILWCSDRIIPWRAVGTVIAALGDADATYDSLAGLCLPLQHPGSRADD